MDEGLRVSPSGECATNGFTAQEICGRASGLGEREVADQVESGDFVESVVGHISYSFSELAALCAIAS